VSDAIETFQLAIPDSDLADLSERLAHTRWPERETVTDSSQGAPLADVQALCAYWRDGYDWRRCEARLNGLGQFRTVIDGLGIHFLHVRSPEPGAMPLILTHGWPGSVVEFLKVIGPLTDPVAHGGDAKDAFHLVIPSLPAYGFSDKPAAGEDMASLTARDQQALADSPAGQAAWIWEKLAAWTDSGGEPPRGGYFAAFEQAGLFVDELRAGFRPVRQGASG
jgi:hypothetical protein